MAQLQSPWLEGAYGWNFGEGGWNSGMDTNLLKFSFMFDRNVDSITAALPPAVNGQAHYLTTDNRLYFAVGTTYFSTPTPKWFLIVVRGTGDAWQFNGTSLVQIDSPQELEARISAVELTVSTLGTAAFQDIEFFAEQSELDVAVANAASYTDTLRSDLADAVDPLKGATLVGFLGDAVGALGRTVQDKLGEFISVTDFGAVGDGVTDDAAAIQAAIDYARDSGKNKVYLPAGTYVVTQTVRIYALTKLVGAGVNFTFLKAKTGSNIGVLETDGFLTLTGTGTKYVTDPGMTWGFELHGFTVDGNRQNNYGGVVGARFGGVGSTVWDGFGIRLYGRRYIVENVNVQYCAGIGFYSECGNPAVPSPADWYYNTLNSQQGHIKGVAVSQCSFDGFVFLGPGDIRIDDVTSELCFYPDETEFGNFRNSLIFPGEGITGMVFMSRISNIAVGGAEIGFIHSHTHKNGYGIRFHGEGELILRVRGENITSEGNLAGIKIHGRCSGQLNKVNIRNQNYGPGTLPDFDYSNLDTETFVISEYENRAASGNAGSIRLLVRNDHLQIGTVSILGGTAGHGVVLDTGVNFVQIDNLKVRDLRGTASDGNPSRGLWTKSSAAFNYITNVVIIDCTEGWFNESSSDNILSSGTISANDTSYPGIVPINLSITPAAVVLRRCNIITRNGVSSKFPIFSGSASINPTLTTEQTVTFTHNMWRTPSGNEVSLSYLTDGANRPTLGYLEVVSTSPTTITARIKFDVAGNGTTASAVFAKV